MVKKTIQVASLSLIVLIISVILLAESPYAAVLPYRIRILTRNCGSYSFFIGEESGNKYIAAFNHWLRERTNQCLLEAKKNCHKVSATAFHTDWLGGKGKIIYNVLSKKKEKSDCQVEIVTRSKAAYLSKERESQSYICPKIEIIGERITSPDCSFEDRSYDYCVDPLYILRHIGRCAIDYGQALKDSQICNILKSQQDLNNCQRYVAESIDSIDACLDVENDGHAFSTCVINYAFRHQDDSVCSLFADRQKWLLEEKCLQSSTMNNYRLDEILRTASFSNLQELTRECGDFSNYYMHVDCLDKIYRGLVYNSARFVSQGKEIVHRFCLDQPINQYWEMCLYSNEVGYSNPSSEMSLGKADDINLDLGSKIRTKILNFADSHPIWQAKLCQAIRWKTNGDKWNITEDLKEFGIKKCGFNFLETGDKGGYE